jgi:hypothetical protein
MSRSDSPTASGLPPFSVRMASPVGRARVAVWLLCRVSPTLSQQPHTFTLGLREPMGSPKFSTLLFLHARRSDPDRPSGISPLLCLRSNFVFSVCCLVSRQCHIISTLVRTNDSSVLASRVLTLSPSALLTLTRLKSLQGGAATPLAYKILCVRFTPVVHVCYSSLPFATLSVGGATLDTGGWLALTRDHLHLSPTGTCTRQEAPSFAWRTNILFLLVFSIWHILKYIIYCEFR